MTQILNLVSNIFYIQNRNCKKHVFFFIYFYSQSTCYAFNTFFWAKLVKDSQSVSFKSERSRKEWVTLNILFRSALHLQIKSNYPQVKRWTRRVDLFSKKHMIITINYELHL